MGEEESLGLLAKEEIRGEQQAAGDTATTINGLPENLLLWDIFHRLHNPKDFLRCKSVCKYWNSLISSLEFDPGFALIVNIPSPNQSLREPHYSTEERSFNEGKGFKLKYLPCFNYKYGRPVCVQASCKDLLLCTKSYKAQSIFYIVNPLTMQWTRLPETPSHRSNLTFPVGLVAKECGNNPTENPIQCVYKVVRLTCIHKYWFRVEVFNSEICGWRVMRVHHPSWNDSSWRPTHYQGLAFNGVLHWLVNNGPIVAYDPFDTHSESCRFIHRCMRMYHSHFPENATITECLTVSQGHLQILQLILFPTDEISGSEAHHIRVWTLVNYKDPRWMLKHYSYFKDLVSCTPWVQDYMHEFVQSHTKYRMAEIKRFRVWFHTYDVQYYPENIEVVHRPEPLACHPNKPYLIYLHLPYSIVSCDLLTKRLKIVSEISKQLESHYYDTVVPITLELKPTPIPSFTETLLYRSGLNQSSVNFRVC